MFNRDKVNWAIRECLQRCYYSSNILATIEDFIVQLRRRKLWNDSDLRAVEHGVRKVLYGILKEESLVADAMDGSPGEVAANSSTP